MQGGINDDIELVILQREVFEPKALHNVACFTLCPHNPAPVAQHNSSATLEAAMERLHLDGVMMR